MTGRSARIDLVRTLAVRERHRTDYWRSRDPIVDDRLRWRAQRFRHMIARRVLGRRFRDLTNNLKLMRREVVIALHLCEPGFAVNAETGLQPLLMGYDVREVPISWIDRTPDMGASSFRLLRVGSGYWRVLYRAWLAAAWDRGPYAALPAACGAERRTRVPALPRAS